MHRLSKAFHCYRVGDLESLKKLDDTDYHCSHICMDHEDDQDIHQAKKVKARGMDWAMKRQCCNPAHILIEKAEANNSRKNCHGYHFLQGISFDRTSGLRLQSM